MLKGAERGSSSSSGGMDGTVSIVWGSQFNELNGNNDVITAQTWSECGIFCDSFE